MELVKFCEPRTQKGLDLRQLMGELRAGSRSLGARVSTLFINSTFEDTPNMKEPLVSCFLNQFFHFLINGVL